jgi:hypothetical protein
VVRRRRFLRSSRRGRAVQSSCYIRVLRLGLALAPVAAGRVAGGRVGRALATSWALAHGKDFYSEILWSGLACVFLDAMIAARPASAGFVAAMLVWVNPALAPVAALAAVAAAAGTPRRSALGAAALGTAPDSWQTGSNAVNAGSSTAATARAFSGNPRACWISWSRRGGDLLFAPACLAFRRPDANGRDATDDYVRRFFRAAAVFMPASWFCSWCWWCGGHFFGPRFLSRLGPREFMILRLVTRAITAREGRPRRAGGGARVHGLVRTDRRAPLCRRLPIRGGRVAPRLERVAVLALHAATGGLAGTPDPPGTIALAAGLTCGTMLRRFFRSPEKESK